jgi:hypothetical protein
MTGGAMDGELTGLMLQLEAAMFEVSSAHRNGGMNDVIESMKIIAEINRKIETIIADYDSIPREVFRIYLDFTASMMPLNVSTEREVEKAWQVLWETMWVVS